MEALESIFIGLGISVNVIVLMYFISEWKRTRKPIRADKARKKTVEAISEQESIDFNFAMNAIKESAGKGESEIRFTGLPEYAANRLIMLGYTVVEEDIDGEKAHKIEW